MRRWIWACVILAVLAGGYWIWPLVGAAQLASAAQRGDVEEVISRVNLPALRRSLARQIGLGYLKVTGRAEKMGALGRSVAGAAATTVADPYIDELLTPANITALLGTGKIARVTVGGKEVSVDRALPGFSGLFNSNLLTMLTGSYFDGLTSFVVPAKPGAGEDQDYKIHLRLAGLNWRLSGVDLPPAIVEDMARSVLRNQAPATP